MWIKPISLWKVSHYGLALKQRRKATQKSPNNVNRCGIVCIAGLPIGESKPLHLSAFIFFPFIFLWECLQCRLRCGTAKVHYCIISICMYIHITCKGTFSAFLENCTKTPTPPQVLQPICLTPCPIGDWCKLHQRLHICFKVSEYLKWPQHHYFF